MHRPVLVALVVLAACGDQPVAPTTPPTTPDVSAARAAQEGPPRRHRFGPDSYRVGLFTGQGVTQPGLTCTTSGTVRECTGFLASAVDSARLDVTLQIPAASGPVPLIVIVHGYGGSKSSSGNIAAPTWRSCASACSTRATACATSALCASAASTSRVSCASP